MGLLRVTKFAYLHIMDPRYALCEDTVEILQYTAHYAARNSDHEKESHLG